MDGNKVIPSHGGHSRASQQEASRGTAMTVPLPQRWQDYARIACGSDAIDPTSSLREVPFFGAMSRIESLFG